MVGNEVNTLSKYMEVPRLTRDESKVHLLLVTDTAVDGAFVEIENKN